MAEETNSFIQNVNALAGKLDIIVESNDIFDEGVIPVLEEIAQLNLAEAIEDLRKGNYLGNRKLDINLALNMQGIDQDLIDKYQDQAEAIWNDSTKTVEYDRATATFTDGTVIQLPFEFDSTPTTISTHGDLLYQLSRLDIIDGQGQTDTVGSIIVNDNTLYVVTIDGTDYEYTSGTDATVVEIVNNLVSIINTGTTGITATAYTNNFTIQPDDISVTISTEVSSNMEVVTTSGATETSFLAKLNDTLVKTFSYPVVGEIVRAYDVIGKNSNLERLQLHAVSGDYVDQNPIYYWAKTTSAFETLAMRAGDIIKLGNEIDNIILLASSINQVLAIQERVPELVDTYVDGVPQGDVTIYNKLTELQAIYDELTSLVEIYNDIKTGGTNYINTTGLDLQQTDSFIRETAQDLQLGADSNIKHIGDNIDDVVTVATDVKPTGTNYTNTVGTDLQTTGYTTTVGTNLQKDTTSEIKIVSDNMTDVVNVSDNLTTIQAVEANETNINLVQANEADITTVATNIVDVQNAEENAQLAKNYANELRNIEVEAGFYSSKHFSLVAEDYATIATNKSNEIKGISVDNTITGSAGSNANVSYNSTDNAFTFVIPKGDKGDRGESFKVNAVGLISDRTIYDDRTKGFSFLALDESAIYFKLSDTNADWSTGAPFGKGDKGDTGEDGNGIVSIYPTSTTNPSNAFSVGGYTDTYTIDYTDGTSTTFDIYNGKGIVDVVLNNTVGNTKTYRMSFTDGTYVDYDVTSGDPMTLEKFELTATAGQTDFTVSYNVGSVDVYYNGLRMAENEYTATTGTNITMAAAEAGDLITVVTWGNFEVADTYTKAEIDTKDSTKAASVHTHVEADITDLDKYTQSEVDTALSLKSDTTYVNTELSNKADTTYVNSQDALKQDINGSTVNTLSVDNIDLSLGNYYTKTLAADWTVTFSNPPASKAYMMALELTNGGDYAVTWPASVKWNGDTPPTLTSGGTDLIVLITDDGGTTYRGMAATGYV